MATKSSENETKARRNQSTNTKQKDAVVAEPTDNGEMSEVIESMNESMYHSIDMVAQSTLDVAASANKEIGVFLANRMKENIATSSELLKCQSWHEYYGVCTGYYQRTLQQYSDEGRILATLSSQFMSNTARSMPNE